LLQAVASRHELGLAAFAALGLTLNITTRDIRAVQSLRFIIYLSFVYGTEGSATWRRMPRNQRIS
jgi:succinate-acetate transporter protein